MKTFPIKWNPEKGALSVQMPDKHKFLLPNHFLQFETIDELCDTIQHNYIHTQWMKNNTKTDYDNGISITV